MPAAGLRSAVARLLSTKSALRLSCLTRQVPLHFAEHSPIWYSAFEVLTDISRRLRAHHGRNIDKRTEYRHTLHGETWPLVLFVVLHVTQPKCVARNKVKAEPIAIDLL